ncbi:MAG: heavy metal-responsive transcriptional regulator [Kofleriaceae bacterium]|nr:heavy metal-responsive transcriptional regulator [Kofleriaceae bacterium]
MTSKSMRIGRLARQANVSVDTVRYYERAQLLPPPSRAVSGYRMYPAAAVDRLRFIRRAKELGFALDEIRELLLLSDQRDTGVAAIRDIAAQRLADVEGRLAELNRLHVGLKNLVDACPGHGDPGQCPILNAFTSANDEH